LYIARPITYRFILIYTCGLTAVIKRICYVMLWSLACWQSVFQWYHSEKHLSEFYPQDGGESQLALKLRHCQCCYPMYMHTICTSLQTDNHTNTSSLNFYRPDPLPDAQTTVSKHWKQYMVTRHRPVNYTYYLNNLHYHSTTSSRQTLLSSSQPCYVLSACRCKCNGCS